jgi:hypothetical protein
MSLGEDHAGVSHIGYMCPDCKHRLYSRPITPEEYYKSMGVKTS